MEKITFKGVRVYRPAASEAGRIDCIVYLNAYAHDCNQGVRCRLVDYRITAVDT